MKDILVITMASVLLSLMTTGTQALVNIKCSLRQEVVTTKDHIYPYFVLLTRCKGSAHEAFSRNELDHKCVASAMENVDVVVSNNRTGRKEILKMVNHTSCRAECALTKSDCKAPAFLSNCECKCPYRYINCGPNKRWNQTKCRCECNDTNRSCSRRRDFNTRTCQCECKQKRVQKCLNRGQQFNYETCNCFRIGHSTSTGSSSRTVSNTFWICALVGEFVLLCIMFELILYHHNHGIIHKLSTSGKSQKNSKGKTTNDSGINDPNGRITDEEDRYVYF